MMSVFLWLTYALSTCKCKISSFLMAASCPCPLQTTSAEKAFNTLPQDKPQLLRGTAGRQGRAPAADRHVEVYVHGALTVATFWNPGSFLPAPQPPRIEPPPAHSGARWPAPAG